MRSFKIFEKSDNFVIDNNILTPFIVGFIVALYYINEKYYKIEIAKDILKPLIYLSCLTIIFLLIYSYFWREKLNGVFNGKLQILEDKIIIKDRIIHLNEIEKIDLYVLDYYDNKIYRVYATIAPNLSNGVDNYIELKLKTGETLKVNFEQKYENEFVRDKEILINYYKNGLISFLRLTTLLNIEKYEEIQELKKTTANN